MNGTYVGIVAYADDLLLLSPTLNGLQEMTKTCEDYGNIHNLTFSHIKYAFNTDPMRIIKYINERINKPTMSIRLMLSYTI